MRENDFDCKEDEMITNALVFQDGKVIYSPCTSQIEFGEFFLYFRVDKSKLRINLIKLFK